MERQILHVDCNKFYASVECSLNPDLRDKPVVVGGNEASRHGIVLTKNEIAARYGISTGETLWSARRKCPDLVTVPPHFPLYHKYSEMVRAILREYTPLVEPFGLDEAWLDVTGSPRSGVEIAEEIRHRVREELGITVSVGVSFNKTFAKLGSDYKKPDAVTVFSRENYRQLVWPLSAGELIYVGRSTRQKLEERFIYTIGDVAKANPELLHALLGKWGPALHAIANGRDSQPVIPTEEAAGVQSVSNGMTTPRDLTDDRDVRRVLMVLAESVGRRMREQHFVGRTVELHLRDNQLNTRTHRVTLDHYIQSTPDIADAAYALFRESYRWKRPLRSVTIGVSHLEPEDIPTQMDMTDSAGREKREQLDRAVDNLRERFGDHCIRRAILLEDPDLTGESLYETHTVHPTGFSGKTDEIGGDQ
ncbi:MAG: DNA polymerase IV [Ruminococcaceae bacterium]|nr:DNA polymerase IV [Oscillospiraceae bacterium]